MKPKIAEAVRQVAPTFDLTFPLLAAVVEVESNGDPFEAADPQTPRFLFERHVFFKQLPQPKRAEAVAKDLARQGWDRKVQYQDQKSSAGRLVLLDNAIAFGGAEAAYRSASWGLFQIMGFNCGLAGYPTAVRMVQDFMTIEGQMSGACRFMANAGLLKALKARDWTTFARGYNGPGFAKNDYHTKLAAAFAKHNKKA